MDPELLDTLGILSGTDKSSLRWDYLRHYQELLRDWRDREFNLIEIGVAGGNSLLSWRTYFSRAAIVGIDIVEDARRCAAERIHIEIGSQADPAFLKDVARKYPPSIVVDDGSHQADHIMTSFQTLFPLLAAGGWYIIEDLKITGSLNKATVPPHEFFSRTAYALMCGTPGTHPMPEILAEIDRVDCSTGIVFVRKKDPAAQQARVVRAIDLVARTRSPNNHLWLAEELTALGQSPEVAKAAAQKAVEIHGRAAIYHIGLSKVLLAQGDMRGAVAAARKAVDVESQNFETHYQLWWALFSAGDLTAAEAAFEMAIGAAPEELRIHIRQRPERRRLSD